MQTLIDANIDTYSTALTAKLSIEQGYPKPMFTLNEEQVEDQTRAMDF